MSDASDNFENDLAKLFFQATNWANVADDASTSAVTTWYISLHTDDPGEDGNQTTNEIAYTSYAREGVARSAEGFDVSGGVASLAENLDFTTGTGGSGTAEYLGLGNSSSSTGRLQLKGAIEPAIVCGEGVTPRLTTSTTFTID